VEECISHNGLVNIRTVLIDQRLSKDDKVISFVRQTNNNPYCFVSGRFIVTASFEKNAPTLENNYERFTALTNSTFL